MEASMGDKRDTMEMCHRLIPMMNKEEISLIALACQKTIDRLISEDRITITEE